MGRRVAARLHRVPASTGRRTIRCSCSCSPGPSWPSGGRRGARASGTSRRSTSSRCPSGDDGRAARRASCPGSPTSCARRSASAPRACRCTRSRRCGCCSTAACWSRDGSAYEPAGAIETLEVPETLHALIAARLDGLAAEERRLLQDAAVLGKTFTRRGARDAQRARRRRARADAGRARAQGGAVAPGRPALAGARAVRLPAGPRAAGRLRACSRSASGRPATSPRPRLERRATDEVVEVVAAHYLAAYGADPEADDADEHRAAGARPLLARAGSGRRRSPRRRRRSATSSRRPRSPDDPSSRPGCSSRPAIMARVGGRVVEARAPTSSARSACRGARERPIRAARVSARLGEVMWDTGRLREALERMDAALELLSTEEPDADVAALAAQVGRFQLFAGDRTWPRERTETALDLAEALGLPEVLSQAVNTKAMILSNRGRVGEAGALVRLALDGRARARPPVRRAPRRTTTSPTWSTRPTATSRRRPDTAMGWRWRAASAAASRSGSSSRRRIRSTRSAAGTRRWRSGRTCPRRCSLSHGSRSCACWATASRSTATAASSTRRRG